MLGKRARKEAIIGHLRGIMQVMWSGALFSEQDTEVFALELARVIRLVNEHEVKPANKEGLCYDTTVGIALYLIEGDE